MNVPVDRKPERAIQAKIRGIQNIYSRWIENPKGRSRQKLGIFKNNTKNDEKEQNKNKDRGLTVQIGQMEECTLCWFTGGDFCQSVSLMGFIPINGNFSLWFD